MSSHEFAYVDEIPTQLLPGKRLVHNVEWVGQELSEDGFRAYFADPDDNWQEPCNCGWASHLEEHYRVIRISRKYDPTKNTK